MHEWSALAVLDPLVFVNVLCALRDLVLLDEPKDDRIPDLRDYDTRQGRRDETMPLVFSVLACCSSQNSKKVSANASPHPALYWPPPCAMLTR